MSSPQKGPIYQVVDSKTGETAYIVSMVDADGKRLELPDRAALVPAGENAEGLVVRLINQDDDNPAASRTPR